MLLAQLTMWHGILLLCRPVYKKLPEVMQKQGVLLA